MALSEPNLEESCNVLENTEEADEDWMKDGCPEYYPELIVQDENSQRVSNQNEHVVVQSLLLIDVFPYEFGSFQ